MNIKAECLESFNELSSMIRTEQQNREHISEDNPLYRESIIREIELQKELLKIMENEKESK